MTLQRIALFALLLVFNLFKVEAQIQLPYVEDFSGLGDSTYTNPTQVEGLDDVRFSGTWRIGHLDSLNEETRDVLSIKNTGQGNDSLIYTLDLSSYNTASHDLIIILEMIHNDYYRSDWELWVRENSSSPALRISQFKLGEGRNHLIFRDISSKLKTNNIQYGPESQIIIRLVYQGYTSSAIEYYFDRFSVGLAPQVDMAIRSLTAPSPQVHFESSDRVSLEITNYGKKTLSEIPIKYTVVNEEGDTSVYSEVIAHTMFPNAIAKVTSSIDLEFATREVSRITANIDLEADSISQNNASGQFTFKPDVYMGELPYIENFDSTSRVYNTFAPKIDHLSGVSYQSSGRGGRLQVTDGRLKIYGDGPDYVPSDLLLTMEIGENDPNDLVMDMEYSYSGYFLSSNSNVYVRGSEEDPWVEVLDWKKYQPSGSRTTVEYLPLTILLLANGQAPTTTFQVKLSVAPDGSGSSFSLYSLRIRPRPSFELKLLSISPQPVGGFNTAIDTLSVTLANMGSLPRMNVPITLSLESSTQDSILYRTTEATIYPVDTSQVIFVGPFDLSNPGNYRISCYLSASDEVNRANDSLAFRTFTLSIANDPLPYFEDFSSFSEVNYTDGAGIIEGSPGYSYLKEDSGNLSITDTYGFRADEKSAVVGKENNLILTMNLANYDTTSHELFLDFAYALDVLLYSDLQPIEIKGDAGKPWTTLSTLYPSLQSHSDNESDLPERWYRRTSISITDSLKKAKQNFSDHTQIRFQGPGQHGVKIYFDDIIIYEKATGINLEAWNLLVPESFIDNLASEEIKVKIINRGEVNVENMNLKLSVIVPAGDTLKHEYPIEGIMLAPGDTLVYPLSNPFDLSADGTYRFIASVDYPGDYNPFDNQAVNKIINRSVINQFPYDIDIPSLTEEVVHAFGEFTQIPGLYVASSQDYMSLKKQSFFNYIYDSTFIALGANYGIRFGGEQSFTWTFDLSGLSKKDTAKLTIFYYLSYFPADYGANDGLYTRGSLDDEWVQILAHRTASTRHRDVKQSINLAKYLYPNEQAFTSTTQVKVVATSSVFDVKFNLISFDLDTALWPIEVPKPVDTVEVLTNLSSMDALIYPNPTNDWIVIDHKQPTSIELLDLSGKVMLHRDLEGGSTLLSLRHLKEGIYLINFSFQDGRKTTKRILLQR